MSTKPKLDEEDFEHAALSLATGVPEIKTVCQVEAPRGGFDDAGRPTILFERHKFSYFTDGKYDAKYPDISNPKPGGYSHSNADEHNRLIRACSLDRAAGLMSASWGKFQIMGFNHIAAGYSVLQDFINAMYDSERMQLYAFVSFLKKDKGGRMVPALREHRWADFARDYNGSGYAVNNYDKKLEQAFKDNS